MSREEPNPAVVSVLAAVSYGERRALERAERNVALAPDARARNLQQHVAKREHQNASLIRARLSELGAVELEEEFRPFLDAFFERTNPTSWLEAQTWHYVGDAVVRDFAEVLVPALDPISAEVTRRALAERDEQESFALDEITRMMNEDASAADRVAAYARRVIGEALTQTRRALTATGALRGLLGGEEGEKRALLDVLQRHRERLDRLGIELVE